MVRVAVALAVAAGSLCGCSTEAPAAGDEAHAADIRDMGMGRNPARGSMLNRPADWPSIEFEPAEMDFGVLPPGSTVRGVSRIWNVGTEPLTIIRSITSCGCTAAEDLTGRVIPPGGFTEFSTTMSMKSGLGEKKEKITIIFDNQTKAVQFFKAEVALPIRVTPPHIVASQRSGRGWVQTTSGVLGVSSLDGTPFRILRAHERPPEFVDYDPGSDPPRSEYTIRWELSRFEGGPIPWYWVLETDRPDCPVVDVRVRHSSTIPARPRGRPWVSKQQRVLVGMVRGEEPFEIRATLEYVEGHVPALETAAVSSESPFLQTQLVEVQTEGQYLHFRIRVTPTSVKPGLLYGKLTLSASGFNAELRVIGGVAG